ncbi:hypothetical protein ACT3TE_09670 [Brachybacterium sp. AOP42-B2-9]|uniref:hypothetical protein n=1 Tax=Brachybacterium sp. AOP42-B2-9 TaxID=3457672 RepID=UPI004034378C
MDVDRRITVLYFHRHAEEGTARRRWRAGGPAGGVCATDLAEALHVAATDSAFSGVIRVAHGGTTVLDAVARE